MLLNLWKNSSTLAVSTCSYLSGALLNSHHPDHFTVQCVQWPHDFQLPQSSYSSESFKIRHYTQIIISAWLLLVTISALNLTFVFLQKEILVSFITDRLRYTFIFNHQHKYPINYKLKNNMKCADYICSYINFCCLCCKPKHKFPSFRYIQNNSLLHK